MREVRTDRNIWKDIVLWYGVKTLLVLIILGIINAAFNNLILGMISSIGGLFSGYSGYGYTSGFPMQQAANIAAGSFGLVIAMLVMLGLVELLYFVYKLYYGYNVIADYNLVCANAEKSDRNRSFNYIVVYLFSRLTGGAFGLYWYYRHGQRLTDAQAYYGKKTNENGMKYLLWHLFPYGGFIAGYLFLKNLNAACEGLVNNDHPEKKSAPVPTPKPVFNPPAPKGGETLQSPTMVGLTGEYAGKQLRLSAGATLVLGRDSEHCNLVFESQQISRIHCEIRFSAADNCYYVTDCSSYENGTLANGHPMKKNVAERLPRQSTLRLGKTETFELR